MPKKVLVIGGGLGGLTTAWALSRTASLRVEFEVTVVQPGGRLGGKCASGREAGTGRILEHGLHMLMGWYDHAFYMLREVYAARASGLPPAYPRALDAFERVDTVYFGRPGTFDTWTMPFPARPGVPGDQPRPAARGLAELVLDMVSGLFVRAGVPLPTGLAAMALVELVDVLEELIRLLATLALPPQLAYNVKVLADIALAVVRGIVADRVTLATIDSINHWDFRAWLRHHGAQSFALDSGLLKGLYDLVFAYPDGDEQNPQVEAGSMLVAALHMGVSYKGAPVWRMRGGMGEVVIAPVYEVLRDRGVKFEFFHRAKALRLSPDRRRVDEVDVARQVDLAVGVTEYQPLVNVPVPGGNLRAWPEEPDWTQLQGPPVSRQELERAGPEVAVVTRRRGVDYDLLVLAVPFMTPLYEPLDDEDDDWKLMRATMRSVATQCTQLWTMVGLFDMGWTSRAPVHSGFVPPFSSWANMSYLLPLEGPTGPGRPRGLVYTCGVTPTPVDTAHVNRAWSDWLDSQGGRIWPGAMEPAGFRYAILEGGSLAAQYLRVNDVDSERYVLSVPGSGRTRIAPGNARFLDVFVAGDWVKGRINGGSAECAVESGYDAADAILAASGIAIPLYPAVP